MADKKHKVVLEIGGAIASSLKSSFAVVTGNTQKLGQSLKLLNSRAKDLKGQLGKGIGGTVVEKELARVERQARRTKTAIESIGKIKSLNIGGKIGAVGSRAAMTGAAGLVGLTMFGATLKTQFLDVASQFESYQTVLETIEGSNEKAKKSFAWISDFAAKTPYDLASVTESFVRLKAYGMDPVAGGLMKTLGDTSAAMGKPVMQAVEAIADAVTGENERLKEFGIKASKEQGKIVYSYTDKAGKQMRKIVNANSRAAIQSALLAIWNEKYEGAMDKLSRSWGGMMSNVGDQWSRFASMVMASGPFEKLKGQLGGFLATLDKMSEDGSLKKYADEIGKEISKIIDFGGELVDAARVWGPKIVQFLEPIGGVKALLIGMAAIPLLPLASSIVTLGAALVMATPAVWGITVALGAAAVAGGPLTLVLVGLGAAIGAIAVYWPQVSEAMENFGWICYDVAAAVPSIGEALTYIFGIGQSVGSWFVAKFNEIRASAADVGQAIRDGIGGAFNSLTATVNAWFENILAKFGAVKSSIGGIFSGGGPSVGSVATSAAAAIAGGGAQGVSGARANGGPVEAGKRYLVGERGPEIFAPSRSGQIIPNGGGGGSRTDARTYNITINAAPGMNERAIADLVMARLDGRQAALAGGALYD